MKKSGTLQRVLVILLTVAVLVGFVVFDQDMQNIGDVLKQISPWWFIGALGCMLLYYLGDTLMYLLACDFMQVRQSFGNGLLTTMIGMFYSALTPFSSGGQPFQIIQMRQRGINVGTATSVLMVKFLAWHSIVTLLGVLGFTVLQGEVMEGGVVMLVLYIIGFLIHAGCLTLGVLLLFKPKWVRSVGKRIIGWLAKFRYFVKHPEKAEKMSAAWDKFIEDYKTAMVFAMHHKKGMLAIIAVAFVEVVSYMAVTYFIYRGMGFETESVATIVLMQALLSMGVAFIPLPGASVGSEIGFKRVFSKYFLNGTQTAGMLIWRVLTYYLTIACGMLAVLIDGFRKKRNQ